MGERAFAFDNLRDWPPPRPAPLLRVTVPVHTLSEANKREHWSKRAKRVKRQRWLVDTWLHAQSDWKTPMPLPGQVPLAITLTRIAPRKLDSDNLQGACKAVRDAIAGWLHVDDRHDHLVRYEYAQERGKPREYAVRIEIRGAQ